MYKSIGEINDIVRFTYYKNELYIKNTQKELYSFNKVHLISNNVLDFYAYENHLAYNQESSFYIYNLELETTICKVNHYLLGINSFTTNQLCYVDVTTNLLLYVNDLDLSNERLLKTNYDWEFLFLSLDHLYIYNKTKIVSLSIRTGENEWELDLEDYGAIGKIIGVFNDKLWVGVGSKALVGIHVKNGEIIHLIEKPSAIAYQSGEYNYFRGHDGQIDIEAKKIVGFEYDTYYELDLETLDFNYWIFREEAKAMKIEARYAPQNIYKEEFIYFIDKLNFKIGVFDRKNKTIKEAVVFSEKSCTGFLIDLQMTDDKMFILDSGGTLHIYENEADK